MKINHILSEAPEPAPKRGGNETLGQARDDRINPYVPKKQKLDPNRPPGGYSEYNEKRISLGLPPKPESEITDMERLDVVSQIAQGGESLKNSLLDPTSVATRAQGAVDLGDFGMMAGVNKHAWRTGS